MIKLVAEHGFSFRLIQLSALSICPEFAGKNVLVAQCFRCQVMGGLPPLCNSNLPCYCVMIILVNEY
ncbi:uncharacterized protein J3R85_002121 [Psidium guajava]|nr:uncharacterized protein J3R85_002121 [Psidium guajava]